MFRSRPFGTENDGEGYLPAQPERVLAAREGEVERSESSGLGGRGVADAGSAASQKERVGLLSSTSSPHLPRSCPPPHEVV